MNGAEERGPAGVGGFFLVGFALALSWMEVRQAKQLREALASVASANEKLARARLWIEEQDTEIAKLHYELDGPLEASKTETPATSKTADDVSTGDAPR